jgi:hypothetical protein
MMHEEDHSIRAAEVDGKEAAKRFNHGRRGEEGVQGREVLRGGKGASQVVQVGFTQTWVFQEEKGQSRT